MRPARVTDEVGAGDGRPAPVLLVAHGSGDPRAARATEALTRAVAAARPGLPVRASYLDHGPPRPGAVLAELEAAGHRSAVLVPLLLTAAYHGRVDIPGAVAAAREAGLRIPVRSAEVLGPTAGVVDPRLLAGLLRRLAEAVGAATPADGGVDGLVLAAAGTRDAAARDTVVRVAEALGRTAGLPTRVGYASAAPPTAGAAVGALRAAGARRVAVATYFLAPGRLCETALESAREAGAVALADPLGDAPELVRLVLGRVDAAVSGDPR
ncbi:CbiX/SirB N-terminal domain-containing protein [Micromonospora sp. WMMD1102]|uniref:sirohydrochlorin chelatase n=1 Tax=Micromonospora sp. WMMD1102 TaxID=3016105 RepID=UPI002414E201|nr:CbiX/SirB N-terminal domain-containing protein [Micromonospora sp. WMMD1102]MDG4784698.1 CbiX/SirB N-terminal domain-containing protein [Micromonospora sp. WMMD1102]